MSSDKVREYMDLVTKSVTEQREANKLSLNNNLDAADRVILRKAADTALKLAQEPATNPI